MENTTEYEDSPLPEGVSSIREETTDQIQLTDGAESLTSNTEETSTEETTTEETNSTEATSENPAATETLNDQIEKHTKALDALSKDLKVKGVDFNQAVKEYNEYGALSSQTMADLARAGYPKEVVETFIESRQVLENKFTSAVYDAAGGEKEYTRLTEWAAHNLPQKVVNSFNRAIDANNLEAVSLMLDGIKAKMTAKQGTRNPSIIGGASNGTTKGFTSKAEVIEAMSDKRYGRDTAYTASVERKMLYTNF